MTEFAAPPPTGAAAALGELAQLVDLKPRLRGWLHVYAAAASVLTGATLVVVAGALRGGPAAWSTAIYATTVTVLFATSALYHRVSWRPRARLRMKRLDHSMIFVFIAGTYTPIAALTLAAGDAVAVLAVVWAGAAAGVFMQTAWPSAPRWLSAPCYIALGWVAVFVLPDLLHRGGVATFVLIVAGGAIYTLGALVYAFKRPDPVPHVLGFHEVFHLCTVLGALCHYVAIWLAVFA